MPVQYLRSFTATERSPKANGRLGMGLAFIAGATNAGGFLAIGYYTSHMSGIVASISDNVIIGNFRLAVAALVCLAAFLAGAATSAILINWGRRRRALSEYATPLLLEAALLLCFGVLGANLEKHVVFFLPATVALLCYIMGLQNALITKISKAEIRTTHVTGLVTDIGIELGKMMYWHKGHQTARDQRVSANHAKLALLSGLLFSFFAGGLAGATGFKCFGFITTVPLACILLVLAGVPVWDDFFVRRQTPRL